MTTPQLLDRNRARLKLLFVGALSLAILIPLFVVRSIIDERQDMKLAAERTIDGRWGGPDVPATKGGLVFLRFPFRSDQSGR